MSEFENKVPQSDPNPDDTDAEVQIPEEENAPTIKPEVITNTVDDPTAKQDKYNIKPALTAVCAFVKRFSRPIILLAVIIALILILTTVFSSPKDDGDTLFRDNMLIFGEINIENQAHMYGVVNKEAKLVCDADFSEAYLVGEGIFAAQKPPSITASYEDVTGSFGLVDKNGDELTKFSFSAIDSDFSEGLIAASEDDKWGYVNKNGEWEIKPKYQKTAAFSEKLGAFKDSKTLKWGYINKKGEVKIKARFEDVGSFKDGIAPAQDNGKWGYINKKGEWVIENAFKMAEPFEDSMARAQDITGAWGYINEKGDWIIKARYEELMEFSDGLAAAKKNGKWGFITKKGEWKINNDFILVGNFKDGVAYAQSEKGGKFGYINKKGKWKIDPKYDAAYDFSQGLACVLKGKSYGYINTSGKTKIPFEYKYAVPFYSDGYAPVCTGKKDSIDEDEWFVINKSGKSIFKETFDEIYK